MEKIEGCDILYYEALNKKYNNAVSYNYASLIEELALIFTSIFPNLNKSHIIELTKDVNKHKLLAISSKNLLN